MGKKSKEGLGRALIKDRFSKNRNRRHVEDNTMLHTTELNDGNDWGRLNLQSVTAESSLQEFLSTAQLAQREFTAEKLNIKFVKTVPSAVEVVTSQPDFDEPLTVPRRPPWRPGVSAEEQMIKERDAFLDWRRHLNDLQAKLGAAVTPYERNLELWKQLWRTLEKSDIVLILLDARNPLLFRCADLEKYAAEQHCRCILLLNKADLTTEYERKCWAEYFTKEKVPVIFFSAAKETAKQRKISEDNESDVKSPNDDSDTASADSESGVETDEEHTDLTSTEDDIELFRRQLGELDAAVTHTADKLNRIQDDLNKVLENLKLNLYSEACDSIEAKDDETGNEELDIVNSHEIFDREKLLDVLTSQRVGSVKNPPDLTIGMIGYPNVGKSSTVNILMETKKVSVSSMPGHTRHVQSLQLKVGGGGGRKGLTLLDCPGLVLPAYAVAPDLLLANVLPIDQMRSHDGAMARLCELVPRRVFETKYGLLLPRADDDDGVCVRADYKQILTAHAFNRGFMTAAGQPDVSRSARLLLKEASSGRLRWAQLPPGAASSPSSPSSSSSSSPSRASPASPSPALRRPTPRETRAVEGWLNKSSEIDKAFFARNNTSAHVKGKPILGITGIQSSTAPLTKPWKVEKKHANKNKREKLRRVYAHLDEH